MCGFQGPTRRCPPRKLQKRAGSPRPTLGRGMGGLWGSFPASIPLPRRASLRKQTTLQQRPYPPSHRLLRSRRPRLARSRPPACLGPDIVDTGATRAPRRCDTATVAQKGWHGAEGGGCGPNAGPEERDAAEGAPGPAPTRWQTLPRAPTPFKSRVAVPPALHPVSRALCAGPTFNSALSRPQAVQAPPLSRSPGGAIPGWGHPRAAL